MKPVIKDHGFCTWVNPRYKNHLFVYEKIHFQNQTIDQTINQTNNNRTLDNQTINQTINQTTNNRTLDNQTADNRTTDNQTTEIQPTDDQTTDNGTADDQTTDIQTADNQTADNQTADNQTADTLTTADMSTDNQVFDNQTTENPPTKNRTSENLTTDKRPTDDQTSEIQPTGDQTTDNGTADVQTTDIQTNDYETNDNQTSNQTLSAANITEAKPSLKSEDQEKIVSAQNNLTNITWNHSSNNNRYKYIKHGYDAVIIILSFLLLAFLIVFIPLLPFLLCTYNYTTTTGTKNQVNPLCDSAGTSGQVSSFSVSPSRSHDLALSTGTSASIGSSSTPLVTRKTESMSKDSALEVDNLPNQPL